MNHGDTEKKVKRNTRIEPQRHRGTAKMRRKEGEYLRILWY